MAFAREGATVAVAGRNPEPLGEHIRHHRELCAGKEVADSCAYLWGDGKTFRIEQGLHLPDGTLVAEITNLGGLLDLGQRRLVPDPSARAHGRRGTRATRAQRLTSRTAVTEGSGPVATALEPTSRTAGRKPTTQARVSTVVGASLRRSDKLITS